MNLSLTVMYVISACYWTLLLDIGDMDMDIGEVGELFEAFDGASQRQRQ